MAQQRAILERPRLTLRTVGHNKTLAGLRTASNDRTPLQSGREPGASTTSQTRRPEFIEHVVRPGLDRYTQRSAATAFDVFLERGDWRPIEQDHPDAPKKQ